MKKLILLVLSLAMLLSLCGCTPKEVKELDTKILSIGEVSTQDKELIADIENGIKALDEKERSKLENYDTFLSAKEEITKLEAKAIYDEIALLSSSCDSLSDTVYDVWKIVGVDYVINALSYMLNMDDDFDVFWGHDYNDKSSIYENPTNIYIEQLLGDAYGWMNNGSFGISFDKDAKEFHAFCLEFKSLYSEIENANTLLSDKIKQLRAENNDNVDMLSNLFVEVSTYADFCLNPSGSLISYTSNKSDYQTEITKLLKAADIY